ncbi:uncharacterized protein LOC128386395 isoform X2 [Panonychus citri]|uniref:uncharacterized protein LOC128386395 isoform X2 n=1 Tax=Panonychus citri TaxID=50023 RepID=UPI002307AA53|nr:uncharacterized protein LOC128386395 isoform X2 [Panonychus citri]
MNNHSNGQSTPMDTNGLNCNRIPTPTTSVLAYYLGCSNVGKENHLIEKNPPNRPSLPDNCSVFPLNLCTKDECNNSNQGDSENNGIYLGKKPISGHVSFNSPQKEPQDLSVHSRNSKSLAKPEKSEDDEANEPNELNEPIELKPMKRPKRALNPVVDENNVPRTRSGRRNVSNPKSNEVSPRKNASPASGNNHVCVFCGRGFSTVSNLNRHRQKHFRPHRR